MVFPHRRRGGCSGSSSPHPRWRSRCSACEPSEPATSSTVSVSANRKRRPRGRLMPSLAAALGANARAAAGPTYPRRRRFEGDGRGVIAFPTGSRVLRSVWHGACARGVASRSGHAGPFGPWGSHPRRPRRTDVPTTPSRCSKRCGRRLTSDHGPSSSWRAAHGCRRPVGARSGRGPATGLFGRPQSGGYSARHRGKRVQRRLRHLRTRRRLFVPLIEDTLHSLRAGRWWLSADQRRA